MNHKQKLGYTVLGAAIMAIGITIGQFVTSDSKAQSNGYMALGAVVLLGAVGLTNPPSNSVFDKITCRKLEVVDEKGNQSVVLESREAMLEKNSGNITVYDTKGNQSVVLSGGESEIGLGGGVLIQDEKGNLAITLQSIPPGNSVSVHGKNGETGKSVWMSVNEYNSADVRVYDKEDQAQVAMGMTERGGEVRVWSKEGKQGGQAAMSVTEHGGHVQAWGKEGKGSALMCTGEHGGFVSAQGNQGEMAAMDTSEHGGCVQVWDNHGKAGAKMSVNAYGNGAVRTWDKHGYPQ